MVDTTQSRRFHEHDTVSPRIDRLLNFYVSKSDRVPTLRHDLKKDATNFLAYSNNLNGTPSVNDFMNTIIESFTFVAHFSSMVPFVIEAGSPVHKMSEYNDGGTVSGTISGTTITGSSTSFLQNIWPGCFINIDDINETYQVTDVNSDTSIEINGALETTFAAKTYTVYRSHYSQTAQYPLNVQQWGNNLVYCAVNPLGIDETDISGPFQNLVGSFLYEWQTLSSVANKIFKPTSVYFRNQFTGLLYYTSDPTSWTTTSTTPAARNVYDIDNGPSTFAAVTSNLEVWESTDLTGATFNSRTSTPSQAYAIASDGATQWVTAGSGKIWDSTNLAGAWTERVASGASDSSSRIVYNGTKYILVSTGITNIYESTDGITWTTATPPTGITTKWDVASSGLINVIVGASASTLGSPIIYDSGSGWTLSNLTINKTLYSVEWSGTYFVATGGVSAVAEPLCFISTDGINWTTIDVSSIGNKAILQGIPSDADITNLLVRTNINVGSNNELMYGTKSGDTIFEVFNPVSDYFRAVSFSINSNYIMLAGTYEWETDKWVYYPKRIRWAVPGTITDFDGEGASFVDCPGLGKFRDIAPVNSSFITLESDGVGVISPTGDLDAAWNYRKLPGSDVSPISNWIVINNNVFYIGTSGKMYSVNESGAKAVGEFDLTKFEDFDTSGPIWLSYSQSYDSFTVFKYTESGVPAFYMVSLEAGAVTEIKLPSPSSNYPRGVSAKKVSDSPLLHVHYEPISDSSKLVSSYFDTGNAVTGVDTVDSLTEVFYGLIETGENRVVREGERAVIRRMEVRTYSDDDDGASFCVEIQNEPKDIWQIVGDDTGTIALTAATCTGTSTVWSNKIADGDDLTSVFTTPPLARQGRYYIDTTLLVLDTDYTITGTNQITLTNPLASGTELFVYWENLPNVEVATGDFIRSTSDDIFHFISSIDLYNDITLSTYPSGSDTGTHYRASPLIEQDDKLVGFGVYFQTNDFKMRIFLVPRSDSTSTVTKIYGYLVDYDQIAGGERRP